MPGWQTGGATAAASPCVLIQPSQKRSDASGIELLEIALRPARVPGAWRIVSPRSGPIACGSNRELSLPMPAAG